MDFQSDLVAPAAPEILEALARASRGAMAPYGRDPESQALQRLVDAVFETETTVFPIATGTAGNALCLGALTPVYGIVYAHEAAHILSAECGAVEFYTGGGRIVPLAGGDGRIAPAALAAALDRAERGRITHMQPASLSLTQATECGTVYGLDHVAALADVAKANGLRLHMDGARLANALAALGGSPADLTWRRGVDLLVLGSTKNGTLGAEAIVVFDRTLAADLGFRMKRGGHVTPKARYLAVQLAAYLQDGRWLRWAAAANRSARRLSDGLARLGHPARWPTEINEVFVALPDPVLRALDRAGIGYSVWTPGAPTLIRLVTNYATTDAEVDAVLAAAAQASDARSI